jgi:hypothetical protein
MSKRPKRVNTVMNKRLFVYGSCQTEALFGLLKRTYPDAYQYECAPFHQFHDGRPLPPTIRHADILIYQPLRNLKGTPERRQCETEPLVRTLRARGTVCVGFPFLHFDGYHPDYCHDPLNEPTRGPAHPWGLFPFGMRHVMELRGNLPAHEVVARTKAHDFLPRDEIIGVARRSLAVLREREAGCDVTVADWVEAHFRTWLLFHAVNHPANVLLERVYNPVLYLLELPPVDLSNEPELLGTARPPIYPCVRTALSLEFECGPVLGGESVTYDDYLTRYATLSGGAGRATVACADCPPAMAVAGTAMVPVRLTNGGPDPWHPHADGTPGVRLSYHWLADGDVHRWDNGRTDLPQTVLPGAAVELDARVEAPDRPGHYTLA